MWSARNAAVSDAHVQKFGLAGALARSGHSGVAIIGPVSMHYSFAKAADLLGIGTGNLVQVRLQPDDRIDLMSLRRAVRRCQSSGRLVIAIVGVAGTTNSGAIDPLDQMADLAAETGCTFHVDAAWGGPVLMSKRRRHFLAGIERADTVTLDGHKQLFLPVGSGILLFRDPTAARGHEHTAAYTVRRHSGDLGLRSPEGSRPGTALLLHAALHVLGRSGYAELLDRGVRLASYLADSVRAHPRFQLLREPQLNIVLYRYLPNEGYPGGSAKGIDALNTAIQRLQRRAGGALVSRTTTTVDGRRRVALRAVLANPMTTEGDIDAVLSEQLRFGRLLEHGMIVSPTEAD